MRSKIIKRMIAISAALSLALQCCVVSSYYDGYQLSDDYYEEYGESLYEEELPEEASESLPLNGGASGTVGTLSWDLTDEGVLTITGAGDMTFDSTFAPWYDYRESVTSVVIGNGVTSIAGRAFYYCKSLTSVTIPNSVSYIGNLAFYHCESLTSVTLPDDLTEMRAGVFGYCFKLESINFPSSLETIGTGAFAHTNLKQVVIPDSVTFISDAAFQSCPSLERVYIPASAKVYSPEVFTYCPSLKSIDVDPNNELYASVDGVLYDKPLETLLTCPGGKTGVFAVPETVKVIAADSFDGCESLTTINIGNSVETISGHFTNGCTSLTAITVSADNTNYKSYGGLLYNSYATALFCCPEGKTGVTLRNGVERIGKQAFYNCDKLTGVTFPSSVTTIAEEAFYDCDGITEITIPKSVTSIGESAFKYCGALEKVTINANITELSAYAFQDCGHITSITLPDSLTSIGEFAFTKDGIKDKRKIDSIAFPTGLESIGREAFSSAYIKEMTLPDSLDSIGEYAFYNNRFEKVVLPNGLETLSEGAFARCSTLTEVTIPRSLRAMTAEVFAACTKLDNVILPEGIESIEQGAFYSCASLTNIVIPDTVTYIAEDAFQRSNPTMYVGKNSYAESYARENGFRYLYDAVPDNVKAKADDSQVTLTWDDIPGASRYAVYIYNNGTYTCLSSQIKTTSYTATGLENGVKVGFKVKSCFGGEWSGASNIVYATPAIPNIIPQNVRATAGDTKATVTWDAVDGATKYAVYKYIDGKYTCLTTAVTGTSYTVTGLTNGVKTGFKVKAYVDQWSGASAMAYATPVSANIVPQNIKTTVASGKVRVNWDKVSGATKYAVYIYEDGKYTCLNSNITTNTYLVTGLENGTKYGFKVKAYAGKWSGASAMAYATPVGNVVPQNVKAYSGDGEAMVSWSAVDGAVRYAVYIYKDGKYTCLDSNIRTTNYTATGLTNGVKVGFKVKAYVGGAWSGASAMAYTTPNA